jgi:hypothetical protein
MVGENLVKFGLSKDLGEEDDEFDDEDNWTGQVDISPKTFIELLPNYEDGAFLVDYYDPIPEVEEEYKRVQEERQKGYEWELQLAQEEYEEAFEKEMLKYLSNIENNR